MIGVFFRRNHQTQVGFNHVFLGVAPWLHPGTTVYVLDFGDAEFSDLAQRF